MEKTLGLILDEIQEVSSHIRTIDQRVGLIEKNMATKDDITELGKKIDGHHAENIDADNILLENIRDLKKSVIFINHKVADTELEINNLKQKQ
ncbi:hypothetical protein [Bacillus mojavensis]